MAEYVLFGFVGFVTVGMLFTLGVVAVLGWRHDEAFARQKLAAMGYEEVEIGERRRIGVGHSLPIATTFYFTAWREGELEGGNLVCCAQFQDFSEQRCKVWEEWQMFSC